MLPRRSLAAFEDEPGRLMAGDASGAAVRLWLVVMLWGCLSWALGCKWPSCDHGTGCLALEDDADIADVPEDDFLAVEVSAALRCLFLLPDLTLPPPLMVTGTLTIVVCGCGFLSAGRGEALAATAYQSKRLIMQRHRNTSRPRL